MKFKFFLILLLAFVVFSCQPHVKPSRVSNAPLIKILLARLSSKDSLQLDGKFLLQLEEARYELGQRNKNFYLSPSKTGFKLYNNHRLFVFNKQEVVSLTPFDLQNHRFKFRNKWHKGKIIFQLDEKQNILVINQLELEEYLKAVLVGEMPSNNDAYLEALKAQAICARTYALKKLKARHKQPFHVYADVRDQVYAGLQQQTKLADFAVNSTRGVVLMYNDSLAQIYFHSTCGGILEDIRNYWNSPPVSYLTSRKDVIGDQFTCQISPRFRWQRFFTFTEIDSLFQKNFQKTLLPKTVQDTLNVTCSFQILQRTSSGRVKSLKITSPDTSIVLENFGIRKFFAKAQKGTLPSLLFNLTATNDSTIVIHGGGYGHGVGLCQWGALNMSQLGFKYYDILVNQYFPGTYLKEIY